MKKLKAFGISLAGQYLAAGALKCALVKIREHIKAAINEIKRGRP